jgi:hypothetical protein
MNTPTGGLLEPSPQPAAATLPQRVEGLQTSLEVLKELLPNLFPLPRKK